MYTCIPCAQIQIQNSPQVDPEEYREAVASFRGSDAAAPAAAAAPPALGMTAVAQRRQQQLQQR